MLVGLLAAIMMFSAAMKKAGARSPETLSAANYWFRHTLKLAWPLYPAFILTVSITGIRSSQLMLLHLYAVPMLFFAGAHIHPSP